MNKRTRRRSNNLKRIILNNINENLKEYIIILGVFIIGIIIGTTVINTLNETAQSELSDYIKNIIINLKQIDISNSEIFLTNIKQNLAFIITLWFFGATGIGVLFVYVLIAFKGFCISYTISTIIATLGALKGLLFTVIYMLLPNIFYVSSIFFLAVKGIKLSRNILSNKLNRNIKIDIVKYFLVLVEVIIIASLASLIEVFISRNILNVNMFV